jgi:hypothetical protein
MNGKDLIPDTEDHIFSLNHVRNRAICYSVEGLKVYSFIFGYFVRFSVKLLAVMRIFMVFLCLTRRLFGLVCSDCGVRTLLVSVLGRFL